MGRKIAPRVWHFFALAAVGKGLSGGDRIFIELARFWARGGHKIHIYVWQEGYSITQEQKLRHPNINFHVVDMGWWPSFGFLINYLARIVMGIYLGVTLRVTPDSSVYSASDFWMDFFPAFLLKIRFPTITWLAGWYQTAPSPLTGFTEGPRQQTYRLTAFFYWLSQLVARPPIDKVADFILVNNALEKRFFSNRDGKSIVVVWGAVSWGEISKWQRKNGSRIKVYDAVFQGRFHPQKGVLELIDIWREVTRQYPQAKLVMIGDGELMPQVRQKIARLNLKKNIFLVGYIYDGPIKYRIFSRSKLVLHPAFFDSGGMAAAEAMAFGIPAVGFDLKSYRSYYPQGMVKVAVGDLGAFAQAVLDLLKDSQTRRALGNTAKKMIHHSWSWEYRSRQVLEAVTI